MINVQKHNGRNIFSIMKKTAILALAAGILLPDREKSLIPADHNVHCKCLSLRKMIVEKKLLC